jgi:hypothetical protein
MTHKRSLPFPSIEELEERDRTGITKEYWHTDFIDTKDDRKTIFCELYFAPYPHLFRPLQWWEERTEDEMPEYVKLVLNGRIEFVHHVLGWEEQNFYGQPLYKYINMVGHESTFCVISLLPATLEEYEQYQSTLTDSKDK